MIKRFFTGRSNIAYMDEDYFVVCVQTRNGKRLLVHNINAQLSALQADAATAKAVLRWPVLLRSKGNRQ